MSEMVRGPSNRPALLVPSVALIVVFAITILRSGLVVASVVLALGLTAAARRI
jgi:hypothetical protein